MREESKQHQLLADRIRGFLLKHPNDPARDRFIIAELRSLFRAATTRGEDWGRLRAEVNRVLAAENSDDVRRAAEYWQLRLDLTDLEGASLQGRITTADRVTLIERFVSHHPKAMISVPLIEELIEINRLQGDADASDRCLRLLREHHPNHVTTLALVGRKNLLSMIGKPFRPDLLTIEGDQVSWRQLRGRVVLVVFWASTNVQSVRMLERTKRIQALHGEDQVVVVTISLDDSADEAREALRGIGLAGPRVCDEQSWSGGLSRRLGVRTLPTVLILDRQGVLRDVKTTPPLRPQDSELEQVVSDTLKAAQ